MESALATRIKSADAAEKAWSDEKKMANDVLAKYKKENSGALQTEEARKMLKDYEAKIAKADQNQQQAIDTRRRLEERQRSQKEAARSGADKKRRSSRSG